MSNFKVLCKDLETIIQNAYESGVTLDEAEKLASKFLYAQIKASEELKKADLDSRMRKSGVKALRAAIYLEATSKVDKKPTEAALASTIDSHDIVQSEQQAFDLADSSKDEIERYFTIFREAHIHFRGISRGRFD